MDYQEFKKKFQNHADLDDLLREVYKNRIFRDEMFVDLFLVDMDRWVGSISMDEINFDLVCRHFGREKEERISIFAGDDKYYSTATSWRKNDKDTK